MLAWGAAHIVVILESQSQLGHDISAQALPYTVCISLFRAIHCPTSLVLQRFMPVTKRETPTSRVELLRFGCEQLACCRTRDEFPWLRRISSATASRARQ